ncbi:MFS transporter [Xaviernesmea oryzae]|uniref:MFS transporter n=1 Tax=Xaviernesmea oryzae TaxID=464029 RepID=A0A1Q9ATZ2_9HYPH|nr:MFS transporter [Xaviernesmea oryzae]OLP58893.1 MFS transporter [Xaviernesmea oryzae]SEM02685.1 Predicted arabinose efflux permease, MFS family [Xaviernesmea oryzae]
MTTSDTLQHTTPYSDATPDRLPVGRLLAFTVAGFLAIMTENMPAGLLPQIGAGLGVSEAMAGQTVTLYALGSVVAAIPVIAATRSWSRRPLFLLAIAGLLAFNTVTAISVHYNLTLVARFIAGMAAGVIWGLVAGYARRLAPVHLQGRALAIVGVGQPVALSLGVPLGAWLGGLGDWQVVFWIMSAIALLLIFWVRSSVPNFPGQAKEQRLPVNKVFTIPGVRPILLVLFAWILAHNIIYTYIAPFLIATETGLRIDVALLVFGFASVVGIWGTGLMVDRYLRTATLISLAFFGIVAILLANAQESSTLILIGIAIWGLTFGGAPTLLQTALADAAGEHADVAQSILVTVFNLAVAGGGFLGGLVVDNAGARSLPWVLLPLIAVGLIAAWQSRDYGFRIGRRGS